MHPANKAYIRYANKPENHGKADWYAFASGWDAAQDYRIDAKAAATHTGDVAVGVVSSALGMVLSIIVVLSAYGTSPLYGLIPVVAALYTFSWWLVRRGQRLAERQQEQFKDKWL
jgi:Flp pilus assembly protein TadB